MESLEERLTITSSTIATGDMGGWVTRVNIIGIRLGRHSGVALFKEALQHVLVVVVFHR